MTRRLSISVPLAKGESPESFLSRLAQANGREHARDFARDLRLDFQGVVEGHPAAIEKLALVSGCEVGKLFEWAFSYKSGTVFLRGEDIGPRTVLRAPVRVCARCLMEDFAWEGIDHEARPVGRALWKIAPLRTCFAHHQSIVEMTTVYREYRIDDFAAAALEQEQELPRLNRLSMSRSPSELEDFIRNRLDGTALPLRGRLGELPLHATATLSETLGTVLSQGVAARRRAPSHDGLHLDGQIGFSFIKDGDDGLVAAIRKLVDLNFTQGTNWGPRAILGCLYTWLCACACDPAYDIVRHIIRDVLVETLPIGPGDKLFGQDVEVRRVHSLYSLSLEHGISNDRIRKLLLKNELMSPSESRSASRILLDADVSGTIVAALSKSLTIAQVRQRLNLPRDHDLMLLKEGYLVPLISETSRSVRKYAFDQDQIDEFLDRFMRDATHGPIQGLCNMREVTRAVTCYSREVVKLVMSGTLATVRIDPDQWGYMSILVDPNEVRAAVAGQSLDGLLIKEVVAKLHVPRFTIKSLIERGHLHAEYARHPVTRIIVPYVTCSSLADFEETYVNVFSLAKSVGLNPKLAKDKLTSLGIAPAFPKVGTTFYRRSDLPHIFSVT